MDFRDFKRIEFDGFEETFGNESLIVLGWAERDKSGAKKYVVQCQICKQDPELFGDGLFVTRKANLKEGKNPCGCSPKHKFSENQRKVQIERILLETSSQAKFLGWDGDFKGIYTYFFYRCPLHGEQRSTVNNFVNNRRGCPSCGVTRRGQTKRLKHVGASYVIEWASRYNYEILEYKFTGRKSGSKETSISYLCPKHGKQLTSISNIKCRESKCRECAKEANVKFLQERGKAFIFSEEMKMYCARNKYTFVKEVPTKRKGGKSLLNFQFNCPKHGLFKKSAQGVRDNNRCPCCMGNSQLECYLNLVFDGDLEVALKFGISRKSEKRLQGQNNQNLFKMSNLRVYQFSKHRDCQAAERACLQELECGILTPRELKDGHTETTSIQNLDKIIEIYERFGGVRIK